MSPGNLAIIDAIKGAASHHPAKYTLSYALTIRWEVDETGAHMDTSRFQSILTALQLPMADEIVIKADDKTPGWTIQKEIQYLLRLARATTQGRTLVIVHYAGHGYNDCRSRQHFLAYGRPGSPFFNAERFLISHALPDEYDLQGATNVDVLFILDTCYGNISERSGLVSPRNVEVIAATNRNSHLVRQTPDDTFTSHLLKEILDRKRKGEKYVRISDICEGLRARSGLVELKHGLRMGDASITLPFTGLSTPAIEPVVRVAMSVEMSDNASEVEHVQFLNWIRDMPDSVALTFNKLQLISDHVEAGDSIYTSTEDEAPTHPAWSDVDGALRHDHVCIRPCSARVPPI